MVWAGVFFFLEKCTLATMISAVLRKAAALPFFFSYMFFWCR
jgi:hypothetical protein